MSPSPTVFDHFARWTEHQLGRSLTFALAVLSIIVWVVTGPFFGWSDTWQLVINTGTTIVTFLMVFGSVWKVQQTPLRRMVMVCG